MAYAAKLDLPSLSYFQRAFPQSRFLTDKRAMRLVALERARAAQKARELEERSRARKQEEQESLQRKQQQANHQQTARTERRRQQRYVPPYPLRERVEARREQSRWDRERAEQQELERRRWKEEERQIEEEERRERREAAKIAAAAVAAAPKVSPRSAMRMRGGGNFHGSSSTTKTATRYVRSRQATQQLPQASAPKTVGPTLPKSRHSSPARPRSVRKQDRSEPPVGQAHAERIAAIAERRVRI